jgi:DNA-binding transcriptional MerR regulator
MKHYAIKDLERLSGIKAHTIRIWEQRYQLLNPQRTDTNIRLYSDDDLRKLLNVTLLLDNGIRISKISELTEERISKEVQNLLNSQSSVKENLENYLKGLIISMVELDEARFNEMFDRCISEMGFLNTVTNLLYPFLVRIGVMWGTAEINPSQEHFMSCLIRQKLIAAISELPFAEEEDERFLLFLPQDELHEIGLIMAHYLLKRNEKKVIYLGQNVPFRDMQDLAEKTKPDYIMTIITSRKSIEEVQHTIDVVQHSFPETKFLLSVSGFSEKNLRLAKNTLIIESLPHFVQFLEN